MRKLPLVVSLATAWAMLAVPAGAHHDGTEEQPTLRTERVYFKCAGDQKVQNIPALQGNYPTWSTEPPPGSFTAGNGCGQYENLLSVNNNSDNPYDLVVRGTFTGNLDTINVEAHNVYLGSPRVAPPFFLGARLFVDGELRYSTPLNSPIEIFPVVSETGISEKIALSFTGIGLKNEHGDGTIEREVKLHLISYNEYQSIWVWDASEVPSGLTFNPETLESIRIFVG